MTKFIDAYVLHKVSMSEKKIIMVLHTREAERIHGAKEYDIQICYTCI